MFRSRNRVKVLSVDLACHQERNRFFIHNHTLHKPEIKSSLVTLRGCADLLPAKKCRVRLNTAP